MRNIGKLLTIIGVVFGMVAQPLHAKEPEYVRDLLDVAVPLLAVGTITAGIVAAKAFRDMNKADAACKHRTPDGRRHYVDARRFFYKVCAVAGTGFVVTTAAGNSLWNKKVAYRNGLARYKSKTADTVMRGKLNAGLKKPVEKGEVVHLMEVATCSAVPAVVATKKPKKEQSKEKQSDDDRVEKSSESDVAPLFQGDEDEAPSIARRMPSDEVRSAVHESVEESSGSGESSSRAESTSVIRSSSELRKELKSLMETGKLEELADVLERVDSESMLEGEILKVLSAPEGGGQGHTILTYVISHKSAKALGKLLKNPLVKKLVNFGDRNNATPLTHAVAGDDAECAALLIEAGAPTSVGGAPLLVLVAQTGSSEMLARLLQDGRVKKTIEDKDEDGRTPLLVAASSGDTDCLVVLLNNYANVRATDENGYNALHLIARASCSSPIRVQCAKALLAKGCDKRMAVGGQTPADMARANGDVSLARALDGASQ
ncbi:MAG: serine/threonine-protein phosphatase 6 regulatory ankyrin repeat subunit [Candidatus Dependentiae bacterium]|nr:serine/threonine-protein phosphatase 6 regulatory ankyrin repeat subunit [Candidatus Dependentiae bacterium]